MINIKLRRYNKAVEIQLPTNRETVMVNLWRLGLERDPGKYTLRQLKAVISYTTPWEHQMIRLIDMVYTLEDAISILHQMLAPPYPIAARMRSGILSGRFRSGKHYLRVLEKMVQRGWKVWAEMCFPLSGEIVSEGGNVVKAPAGMLVQYGQMIDQAVMDLRRQTLHNETYLFSDVDGFYENMLSARWSVEELGGRLVGKVKFLLSGIPTMEETACAAEKIEMIHSMEFAIRLKQWSVLTDRGLLFLYLCDHDGNYEIISLDEPDDEDLYDDEEDLNDDDQELDNEEEEQPCLCPECRKLRACQVGMILVEDVEDADD